MLANIFEFGVNRWQHLTFQHLNLTFGVGYVRSLFSTVNVKCGEP
jgi:hypothetical protein